MTDQRSTVVPILRFPEFKDEPEWDQDVVGELIETVTPPKKLKTSDYSSNGRFPIIDQSQNAVCGWTDDEDAVMAKPLPVVVFGDHTCSLKLVERPFAQGADGIKILSCMHRVTPAYLFHYLNCRPIATERYKRHFSDLKERLVAFPRSDSGEQQAIAGALGDVDALLERLDQLIVKKRDLRVGVMQRLLSGQDRLPGHGGAWHQARLGDVGRCLRGVTYRGDSDLLPADTPTTHRLLRANNVQGGVILARDLQFVKSARVSPHQLMQKDDILICMANGSRALVGKAGLFSIRDEFEYTFGAFMGCLRVDPNVADPRFVFYLFSTAKYRDYIHLLLAGSTINNLRPSSIESLEFEFPSIPEQRAIADVVTDLDRELASLQERRDKTANLKLAMMQELLTGKTRLTTTGGANG